VRTDLDFLIYIFNTSGTLKKFSPLRCSSEILICRLKVVKNADGLKILSALFESFFKITLVWLQKCNNLTSENFVKNCCLTLNYTFSLLNNLITAGFNSLP